MIWNKEFGNKIVELEHKILLVIRIIILIKNREFGKRIIIANLNWEFFKK